MNMPLLDHSIVLFDGYCTLCNGFVNFIIDRDPCDRFRFASLQSDVGQALLKEHGFGESTLESVVLIENDQIYTRSSAAIRIIRHLSGLWSVLVIFLIVPRPIRDWVYGFVARNRYRWFGKLESCRIPTPELLNRFIK